MLDHENALIDWRAGASDLPFDGLSKAMNTPESPKSVRRHRSAITSSVGLIIAFLAFFISVLSPWIVSALTPKPQKKSLEEAAVDAAVEIKDRLVAKATGEEIEKEDAPEEDAGIASWIPAISISLAAMSMCLGVVGFIRREDLRIAASAFSIGTIALFAQFLLLIVVLIIFVILVGFILLVITGTIPTG